MVRQIVRGALLVVTFLSLATPSAQACNCFSRLFGGCGCGTTANYAPYSVGYTPYVAAYAPACGCAPAAQVVNYVPQTSYRTVYVNMPVVAYQPVTACSPCGGCPTTVMRPVTSYVAQPRLVPYTSYRPVVTAAYAPVVAAPAVAAAYYAPAAPAAPAPCCGAANYAPAAPAVVASPVTSVPTGPPAGAYSAPPALSAPAGPPSQSQYSQPSGQSPYSQPGSGITAPGSSAPGGSAPSGGSNRTFGDPNPPAADPQSRLIQPNMIPSNSPSNTPRALDPENQDQSTALPRRANLVAKNVPNVPVTFATTTLSDEGAWRASSR